MSFLNYESYKATNALLFPEIPSDWTLLTFKHLISGVESGTSVNATDVPVETEEQFGVLKTSCVYSGEFRPDENKTVFTEELERVTCPVKADTLIVSRMNTPDLVGAAGYSATAIKNIFLPDRLWQVTFKLGFATFVNWFSKTSAYRDQIKLVCAGTSASMQNISQDDFRNILVTAPTVSEARQIARFLDHEVGKIDALIAEQEKLIALLKEKRQAVISHAVTKGLNPDVQMKDSGVEWLGQVPEHWVVSALKYKTLLNPSKSSFSGDKDQECSFVPMEKLKTDVLILDEVRSIDEVFAGYTYFEDGDILMAKVTPCFENKNIAIASNLENGIGFGSSEIYVLRPISCSSRFLFYRLQEDAFMTICTASMTGAGGLKRVPSELLNNFTFAFPDISEQNEIAAYLDSVCDKYSILQAEAEAAIELFKERRSALISAAVTGKIDVRSWQPPAAQ